MAKKKTARKVTVTISPAKHDDSWWRKNVGPLTKLQQRESLEQTKLLEKKIKNSANQKPTRAAIKWDNIFQTKLKYSPTVGELISDLSAFPTEAKIYFSGLDFSRLKLRGKFVQVEFGQIVYLNKRGKLVVQEVPEE